MSDPHRDPEGRVSTPQCADEPIDPDAPGIELRSVVVRYETRPDQCTVYPRRESCCEHVDAWISADVDAFVSLAEMR